MPAPGAQYESSNIKNPFDERTVNSFTAQEIATLQSRLNKQLGPEYISHRQGAGGGKVAYLEGTKAIALANDVFGFNGWSSSLQQVQIDYVDETQNGRISLGLSIIVRVTLKDGTYHEDMGYGMIENCKGKGAAFEKAKKEAATDGLKRALRNFGNVLGNCLYDKEYLKKVGNMKVKPVAFNEQRLHRHPDFRPPPQPLPEAKDEWQGVKKEEHRTPVRPNAANAANGGNGQASLRAEKSMVSVMTDADDEFGENLFDGVEMSESHEDDFSFEGSGGPMETAQKPIDAPRTNDQANGRPSNRQSTGHGNEAPRQPMPPRVQSVPNLRAQNGPSASNQPNQQNQGPNRPAAAAATRPPQQAGNSAPNPAHMNGNRRNTPTADIHAAPRPQNQPQQVPPQNQPFRPTPPQAQQPNQTIPPKTPVANQQPPGQRPTVGFVTSRAAELMQNSETTSINNLPAFNPHADSPLAPNQRTPGIDHTRSRKIKREAVNAPAPPAPPPQPQTMSNAAPQNPNPNPPQQFRPVAQPSRPSFVNPHQDPSRRIGMPAAPHAQSPLANRGAYKPPSMTSGTKRAPLADVSNQPGTGNGNGSGIEGPEAKKPRLSEGNDGARLGDAETGNGVENAFGGAPVSS